MNWYNGRWRISAGNPDDMYSFEIDVDTIENGFVVGTDEFGEYSAISISAIQYMDKI